MFGRRCEGVKIIELAKEGEKASIASAIGAALVGPTTSDAPWWPVVCARAATADAGDSDKPCSR
jgi:hypothetical protein